MTRVLKFIGAFLGTAAIVFSAILFINWNAFTTFFDNRDAMAEGSEWVEQTYSLRGLTHYIGQNPDRVSVASLVAEHPDSSINYMEQVRRPMGTTANFFIMLAAADLIESGKLSPDQTISWEEVTQHQIPGVNRSEHEQSYSAAQNRDWLNNRDEIELSDAVKLLAEYNDLALADHIWWLIGPQQWQLFSEKLSLENTDLPLPFSGLYLTISPGIREMEADEIYNLESVKEDEEFRESVIKMADQFVNDQTFRENTINYTEENRLGNTFIEERNGLILFPKTTAAEMSGLLRRLTENTLISEALSRRVKDWMRWPMDRQSGISRDFSDYGAIYDNRMGLLNGIDFGTSMYTGDTTVQAVFFDRVQIAFWFHMSSNHMHQDFQQRLIFDPAMIEQMKQVESDHAGEQAELQN
ncbi:MAG: serine hydrolase [Bacteroidota bacterium]